MENVWVLAAIWVGLALIATLLAIWLKISTALTEIVVGTVAQLVIGAVAGSASLGVKSDWIGFLAGTGAIVLTFLAGAELDATIIRTKWREAGVVGLVGFIARFLGCSALAFYLLHWSLRASLLAGVALSTTSVAVVYAVMLELGFNKTDFGKAILAACFVNDGRVSKLEAKYLLLALFAMGGLAVWAGSEAVLSAYIIGMVLAGTVGKGHVLIRRVRTPTFGFLTPFYFIRAGSFVSVPALIAAPVELAR
jgi:glutathione-regulated potassium-efflux system ancillary protein KefC